jgi:hypothetical protein
MSVYPVRGMKNARAGVSFARTHDPASDGSSAESRKAVVETEQKHPHASLMAVKGNGMGKDTMFITLYKNYTAYTEAMQLAKQIPHVNIDSLESFLVDLNDKNNYRNLTMLPIPQQRARKKEWAVSIEQPNHI